MHLNLVVSEVNREKIQSLGWFGGNFFVIPHHFYPYAKKDSSAALIGKKSKEHGRDLRGDISLFF